jgi:hypothetical protein
LRHVGGALISPADVRSGLQCLADRVAGLLEGGLRSRVADSGVSALRTAALEAQAALGMAARSPHALQKVDELSFGVIA